MGYETKLYVVDEYRGDYPTIDTKSGKIWCEMIAMFDMCKCPMNCFWEEARGFFIEGTKRIVADEYGEPLKAADIKDVIKELEGIAREGNYWRAEYTAESLKAIDKSKGNRNIKVYSYGY